jgi:[ribosomal protein S5]-alanine N-acetyltransferase
MESWFERIPTLVTPNYTLRGIEKEDGPCLFDFLKDKETMKYITPTPVQTLKEVEESLQEQLARFVERKEIPWVIEVKATGEIIGTFRFHKLHLWHKKAEMGVVISKEFQKKGIMTEILPFLLKFAFQDLRLNRLVGDIFAENKGSTRILTKFGFKKEGQLRQTDFDGEHFHDTVVYSLLKTEYKTH